MRNHFSSRSTFSPFPFPCPLFIISASCGSSTILFASVLRTSNNVLFSVFLELTLLLQYADSCQNPRSSVLCIRNQKPVQNFENVRSVSIPVQTEFVLIKLVSYAIEVSSKCLGTRAEN